MTKHDVDVAVIGAGTAGMGAARAAMKHGVSIALIEGEQYGTTCARVGCMPLKLLIAAAEAAHNIELVPVFGVMAGSMKIDGEAVMKRVRAERDRFVGFATQSIEKDFPGVLHLRGHARFLDDQVRFPSATPLPACRASDLLDVRFDCTLRPEFLSHLRSSMDCDDPQVLRS